MEAPFLLRGAVHIAMDLHGRPQESLPGRSDRASLKICRARQYVVASVKRIETETIASAESTQVLGMSCIKPMAPRDEIACAFPPLSICITARVHRAGAAKRADASTMYPAKRSMLPGRAAACASAVRLKAAATASWHTNGAMATIMRAIIERDRS